MRLIRFEKYDKVATTFPIPAQAWQILWLAINSYPTGNKDQTLVGYEVVLALREISESLGSGERYLQPAGGDVYLDDSEFRLLGQAVEAFRQNIRMSGAEALIWIDKMLEKAPEIAKDVYKAGQRLKIE